MGARQAGDRRAEGGRRAQARDGRATGARQAGDRRATGARQARAVLAEGGNALLGHHTKGLSRNNWSAARL